MGYMSVLFIGKNLPKFKLENMIWTYMQRIFHVKDDLHLPDFKKNKFKLPDFNAKFQYN
jgi:hypothetical protein